MIITELKTAVPAARLALLLPFVLLAGQVLGCGKSKTQSPPAAATTSTVSVGPTTAAATSKPAPESVPRATMPDTSSLDLGDGMKLDLVLIPAGSFMMGSPDAEDGHNDSESPVHKVTIGKAFYIGKYEVTQAQFLKMTSPNKTFSIAGDDRPCEEISWSEAKWFCDNASKKSGRNVRLPSEAEWEYAARAGTTGPFWFGTEAKLTDANFGQFVGGPAESSGTKTSKVGSYKANAWGVCDTVGNVAEWCQDVYHEDYKGAPADGSPWETGGNGTSRVYRGGAYNNDASGACRAAARGASSEPNTDRVDWRGFRVVVDTK